MWAMTSRVDQPVHAVGASHAPGRSAISNICWASLRTTLRMVFLPSYVMAFHSFMFRASFDGDEGCAAGAAGDGALAAVGGAERPARDDLLKSDHMWPLLHSSS